MNIRMLAAETTFQSEQYPFTVESLPFEMGELRRMPAPTPPAKKALRNG